MHHALRKYPPHSWARGVTAGARVPKGGAETTQPTARMIPSEDDIAVGFDETTSSLEQVQIPGSVAQDRSEVGRKGECRLKQKRDYGLDLVPSFQNFSATGTTFLKSFSFMTT